MTDLQQRNLDEIYDPRLASELRRIELRTKRSVNTDLIGNYRSAFRGSGLVFSDIREYQPGDEVKNIHWKVTARTGKAYVKSYDEDRQLSIVLAIDVSSSTNFGAIKSKHLRALEFAALIAILADKNQDSLGLCLFSDQIEEYLPPGKARNQMQRVLMSLLRKRELRSGTDVGGALEYIHQHQRRNSVVFLVSDFLSPPFEDRLRLLAYRHDVIAVFMEDRIDVELPGAGMVEFQDAESGARCIIDTSSRRVRERLAALHERRLQELQQITQRCGADFMKVTDNPLRPLANLMHRRTARVR